MARTTSFSETSFYRVHRLVSQLAKAAEQKLREGSGMSFSQFLVLQALTESAQLSQAQIATYVGVTPAVMTKQVDYLCAAGWVVRSANKDDRRQHVIRLSPGGRQLIERLSGEIERLLDKELDGLLLPHYRHKLVDTLGQLGFEPSAS